MADPIAAGRRVPSARDLVLRQQLRRVLIFVLLGVLPAIWIGGMIVSLLLNDLETKGAYDLKVVFLPAAHAVLHGGSPYPGLGDAALSHQAAYVYPPFVAFVVTPLTVFSVSAASVVGVIGSLLVIPVILALADVRDWRCYGVALCWSPVLNAVQNVNVSVPIALLVALAWRFRRAWLISGLSIGCAVAAKVFVWPLLFWPLAVARWRALVTGIATAAALALGSWAAIGFKGFSSYPTLVRTLTSFEETESYSVSGALRVLGLPVVPARGVALLLTVLLCALCVYFGRRRDEPRSLAAAALAALASTPILWQHYLVLLLVVLAVCRPRLSAVWFVPWLLWLAPYTGNGNVVQTLLVPIGAAVIGAVCLLPEETRWACYNPLRRLVVQATPSAGSRPQVTRESMGA